MSIQEMNHSNQNRSRGLSLVELLVAIAIGAILLAGAVTLFVNNRDTYRTTNDLSRLQETARFALDMITKDIRMAGHFGCSHNRLNVASNIPVVNVAGDLWRINMDDGPGAGPIIPPVEGLEGADADPRSFYPSGFQEPAAIADSDGITLRYLAASTIDVQPQPALVGCTGNCIPDNEVTDEPKLDNPSPGTHTIPVDSSANFVAGNLVGISNCRTAEVVQISATPAGGTTLETNSDIAEIYETPADEFPMVSRYVGVRYFVGNSLNGTGPALFRTQIDDSVVPLAETTQELFEGVESLQFQYGVDTDGDGRPDNYLTADAVADWLTVVSVRVGILVRSVDELGRDANNQAFTVLDENIPAAGDRRHRRVFTTTVLMRNV